MQTELFIGRDLHPNSIMTYREKIIPTLTGRKLEVLNAIKSLGGECTGFDLIEYLNKPYHKFSGRLTEMKKMGLIVDTGVNKIINGSPYSVLRIVI